MKTGTVILKKGKDRPIVQHHHWIFSGAVQRADAEPGSIVQVLSDNGSTLGMGYYNPKSNIPVRMLTFGDTRFTTATLKSLIYNAISIRDNNPLIGDTNAMRLVFSEGDFLPGLIVDRYGDHLCFQILTLGMDRLKNDICEILSSILHPASIYERSDHGGRAIEGLPETSGQIYGTTPDEIIIHEHGVKYPIDIKHGQKTGFFIDQRDNRALVKRLSKNRRVINFFSYTGGFTFAALCGGASHAVSVDISRPALVQAEKTGILNGYTSSEYIEADVFEYLRNEPVDADMAILDPPAFAKSSGDVDRACRGYKDINLQLLKKIPPNSYVLTCSCSRFIDMDLFQKVVFAAAHDASRNAQIVVKNGHPADHPVNLNHPETEYLKAILLFVR